MITSSSKTDAAESKPLDSVLVIGLDGATWQLLDPLIQDGTMPVLAELVQDGVRGDLLSTHPFLSPVAWTSMATGVYPGKHRVFGFFDPRYTYVWAPRLEKPTRPVSATDIGTPVLYRVLNKYQRATGLIMVPVTHPPQPLEGYIVGDGILTPNERSDYTYPPGLKEELLAAVPQFRVRPYEYLHHRLELIDEIIHYVDQQGQAARWLMKNYPTDFTMVVFTATDVIQHRFWKYMDPVSSLYASRKGRKARPTLWSFYRLVDRVIGELIAQAGPDAATILVSDHGFTSARRIFLLNHWLYERGLLYFADSGTGKLRKQLVNAGVTQDRLFGLLKKMDMLNLRQRLRGRGRFAAGLGVRQGIQSIMSPPVDWSRTRAYAGNVGEPYIYINLQGRDPSGVVKPGEEYERLCDFLCTQLANLRDPDSDRPIVRKVYRAAELYPGPYSHEAPDIIIEFCDASLVTSDAVQVNTAFQDDWTYRGTHDPYGILLLRGPGIRKGAQIEEAHIVDVMPTVLHLLGVPLLEGLDGRVLTEVFSDRFLAHNPVRYTATTVQQYAAPEAAAADSYTDEESSEIEQRLRELGYIT